MPNVDGVNQMISGGTAGEIARSVRGLADTGALAPGDPLPPVRTLADQLGVNRNTVVAAYRQLSQAGVAVTQGRAGTSIARPRPLPDEGFAQETVLRDLGSGNPDPALLPKPSASLMRSVFTEQPVLYGESTLDSGLARWATEQVRPDCPSKAHFTVTAGAVDAVDRLLALHLSLGDLVALEDPCFLASIHTVRLAGYRTVPVPVDSEGMTVAGLQAALDAGVRAVVCTPRAHNPTGVSLSAERAAQLRAVLAEHPFVLVIADDHFSLLSQSPYHSIIDPEHRRWALVRSVSKFLGPDMRLALVACDPETAGRFAARVRPGTMWISHTLQRLAFGLLNDPKVQQAILHARDHYALSNATFVTELAERGVQASAQDGLNVWVDTAASGEAVNQHLMRRGWLVRVGEDFALANQDRVQQYLRLTVHTLDAAARHQLLDDLVDAINAEHASAPKVSA
jgi:DNA-binding transcriptional MocR family regulator